MPNELSEKVYPDGTVVKLRDDTAREQIANLIKYTDITIKTSTSGHSAPTMSAGGAYYEGLVDYTTLGVTKDKILSVEIIAWDTIKKPFTLYLGSSTISAMSDSSDSIYVGSGSFVSLRVVYRG